MDCFVLAFQSARGVSWRLLSCGGGPLMRAEMETLNIEIEQSLTLLRRYL